MNYMINLSSSEYRKEGVSVRSSTFARKIAVAFDDAHLC